MVLGSIFPTFNLNFSVFLFIFNAQTGTRAVTYVHCIDLPVKFVWTPSILVAFVSDSFRPSQSSPLHLFRNKTTLPFLLLTSLFPDQHSFF